MFILKQIHCEMIRKLYLWYLLLTEIAWWTVNIYLYMHDFFSRHMLS